MKAKVLFIVLAILAVGIEGRLFAQKKKSKAETVQPTTKADAEVKNVIFLIGDGMGLAQSHALMLATNKMPYMFKAPVVGLISTNSYTHKITDSGAGGTALATGYKTRNGMIGMRPDSTAAPSLVDIFASAGRRTGVAVTCDLTHATPADFVAKNISRKNEQEIAADFIKSPIDVAIGGGLHNFTKRKDGRNLVAEMTDKGFAFFGQMPRSGKGFSKLLVLTDTAHPAPAASRTNYTLAEATRVAIEALSTNNDKGFFLMVEGSQIDWAGHANDSAYLITEMIDFDKAVGVAVEFAEKNPGTLVVVTADHETGGLTFIHGDNKKNPGVKFHFSTNDHSGVLVPVYAFGAGAHHFSGVYDNTDVFRKILKASGLEPK
ncbi:MAG: alkaline phosphatase [Bacteroidetes bacterium]|nr:alkaline phosphatase [Bacteroidota bacterium]